MYRIAVLGDNDSIYGFATLGLFTFPVVTKTEAASTLKQLCEGPYAVIYVTEQTADMISAEIEYFSKFSPAVIILIPGLHGNTGMGMKKVKKLVEKAVGSDIIFGND